MEICGREERPDLMNMNMILRLVRYVDYSILTVANRVMVLVTKCIEKKLGLKVNATKFKVIKPTKLKCFGFEV
ncbi:hypothetical protein HMPREF3224_00052 [Anaerococcus hydrogenalis]|nr:hypothetical protein HMPREF3224_00052 [Anaerococcus hydrogenalis]